MSHSSKLLSCTAAWANVVPGNRDFYRTISLMYNFKTLSHNYNARIIRYMVQFGVKQKAPSQRIAALKSYLILNCIEVKK